MRPAGLVSDPARSPLPDLLLGVTARLEVLGKRVAVGLAQRFQESLQRSSPAPRRMNDRRISPWKETGLSPRGDARLSAAFAIR